MINRLMDMGWLSSDRELDSLLSATPFNIVYFHCIIVALILLF